MAVYGKNSVTRAWTPSHPEKYVGDVSTITSRSSWETKFMNYCDLNPDVLQWSSEEVVIPYFDPVQGKQRRYFVDFWIEVLDRRTGNTNKVLIEIKPDKFTRAPEQPKKKTKRFIEESLQFATNTAKWQAAREVCERSGVHFRILTEYDLGIEKKR